MVLTRNDLRTQLKRREIAPVYLLYGAETYLRDVAAKTIADLAFAEGEVRDFNETAFSLAGESTLKSALAAAQQLPMMAARRVVKITDIRISASGFRDTVTEADEPVLSAYLADPAPHSVVIFVADELNGVRKMGKLLKEKSAAVEFTPLDDRELAEWAQDQITKTGAVVDTATLRYLVGRVGPDLRLLTNEINKLTAAALPGKTITVDLVDALVPHSRELSNFELTDHLVAGKKTLAISSLRKMLDDGVEPLQLLGLISYNYRRLLMAKELMSRGVDRREVAGVVKLRWNDQEPFLAAARRADEPNLARAIKRLADADLAMKTSRGGGGPQGARMQIEMLVCELALL
jgi:DNA polymerase-3 subunit delta